MTLLHALAVLVMACLILAPRTSLAAVTANLLTSGASGSDTNIYITPVSITTAANTLILAWITNNKDGTLEIPSVSSNGLTWEMVDTVVWGGGSSRSTVFRAMAATSSSSKVTITFPADQKGCAWVIQQFNRVATWGTNGSAAVIQSGTVAASGDQNSDIRIELPSAISYPGNASVGCFTFSTQAGTASPGADYSTITLFDYGPPVMSVLTEMKVPGKTLINATPGAACNIGGIGIEVGACANTYLGTGSDPGSASLAPGDPPAFVDAFTFQTNRGTNLVSDVTVSLSAGTYVGIARIEITNDAGTALGFADNPGSNTVTIPLTPNISIGLTETQYKIRITPKSHAAMPVPAGATYAVKAYISNWTDTNDHTGTDSTTATLTIDNQSPVAVSAVTAAAGDGDVTLTWTNPGETDLGTILVLRKMGGDVLDKPVEGEIYDLATNKTAGASSVACVVSAPAVTCLDSPLTNNKTYYYRVFTRDANGNYSAAGTAAAAPAIPNHYQADVLIKLSTEADTAYASDNVYETTATSQVKSQGVVAGSTATYNLRFQNDGSTTDKLVITGTPGSSSFAVQYKDGANVDKTASVTGAGFTTADLAAGAYLDWTLTVRPAGNPAPVAGGTAYQVSVGAASVTNTSKGDQVKAATTSTSANITLTKTADKSSCQPGEDVTFTTAASNAAALTDAKTVEVIDPIPANTGFKLGSATFSAGNSTLTAVVSYSNGAWGYTPVSGRCSAPAGYDYCVTHVKWAMTGNMPTNTNFTVSMVVKVK